MADESTPAAPLADPDKPPPAEALPPAVLLIQRFFPAEAKPLFDLFDGPFTLEKLWPAFIAIGQVGPKIIHTLGPTPIKACLPASTISREEKLAGFKEHLDAAEVVTCEEHGHSVKLNPLLAAALAALVDEVCKYAAEQLKSL